MKIVAEETTCDQVKPGELFSTAGQSYWSHYDPNSIGQKLYVRTEAPCPQSEQGNIIYRITIQP